MLKELANRPAGEAAPLDLERFLPYRLTSLAEGVSAALAAIYRDRFDLTRNEWRVIAILSREDALTAAEVGRRTSLDKMQSSRAVQALVTKGDVARKPDPADKRNRLLHLTPQGRRLYQRIAPLALEREAVLLAALTPQEGELLWSLMDRLAAEARRLTAGE